MSVVIARCRSCDESIVWMVTSNNKNMPVDADSIDESELEYHNSTPCFDASFGHISHFATCPNADQHRRR